MLRNLSHEIFGCKYKNVHSLQHFCKGEKSYMLINVQDTTQKNELDSYVLTCKELQDTLFSEKSKVTEQQV